MPRKYTYEEVKEIFNKASCKLLEKEYKNSTTLMNYTCNCGNQSKIRLGDFNTGIRCKKCGREKIKKTQSFDYEYVKNYFEDQSCKLLSKEYKNNRTKLDYMCSCANKSSITFDSFKAGHRCKICGRKKNIESQIGEKNHRYGKEAVNKFSIKKVRAIFEEFGCTLYEKDYKDQRQLLRFYCYCGRGSRITLGNFISNNGRKSCKKCMKTNFYTLKKVKKIFKDGDCKLLEKEYKNNQTPMKYICSCGVKSKIRLSDFLLGRRCKQCGIIKCSSANTHYFSYKFIKTFVESKSCKLLSKDIEDKYTYKSKILFKCSCKRNHVMVWVNFYKYYNGFCRGCVQEGERSPMWNPNITKEERERGRKYPEYKEWVKKVYKKDNYTCQYCKLRSHLNAHHILNYAGYKELRLEINNGITFCEECHIAFHKIYGYKGNNMKQIKDYLGVSFINSCNLNTLQMEVL